VAKPRGGYAVLSLERATIERMSESFLATEPRLEDYWRAIILFGRNVASCRFSLANALLELKATSGQLIKHEELAAPFSRHLCDHLRTADKQGTFSSSKFLDACRKFNAAELTKEGLIENILRYGFNNVIDAFPVIGRDPIPRKFFIDERQCNNGIRKNSPNCSQATKPLARLWEGWKDPANNQWLHARTINTGEPNEFLREIHTRMRVIPAEEHQDAWLSGEAGKQILVPYPADRKKAWAESVLV
jgi:hypothetical protein